MASFSHKNLSRIFIIFIALLVPSVWAQVPDIAVQKTLPINLNAESSEFDRQNNTLFFRSLRITQGIFGIEADEATAAKLDFDNSLWVFTGNVVIESQDAKAYSDRAEVLFREHQVRNAVMQGTPVRFAQVSVETGKTTEGHSNVMEYDLDSGILRMSDDAWLSDGANEVSGNRISYDLISQYITADSDERGPVRMKINPPQDKATESGP
jgi:lipopolysaccharide export system protein LptA